MNGRLMLQTWRWHTVQMIFLVLAAIGWGWLIVFIFTTFAEALREMVQGSPVMEQLTQFGSGNFFTLPGALTLGFQHPLAIAMLASIGVASGATAIAGERERGTLEVLLARPISRTTIYLTIFVSLLVLLAILMASFVAGMVIGLSVHQLGDEVDAAGLPLVFANGLLLWAAFAAFAMAATVTFDRPGPAIGLSVGYLLTNYFLEILGSLWTDVQWSQEYSLFHHFQPGEILTGAFDPIDLLILGIATAVPVAYALLIFPRRDLAAPS